MPRNNGNSNIKPIHLLFGAVAVIATVKLAEWGLTPSSDSYSFSQLNDAIQTNIIKSVDLSGRDISGVLKNGVRFHAHVPEIVSGDTIVKDLQDHGVQIDSKEFSSANKWSFLGITPSALIWPAILGFAAWRVSRALKSGIGETLRESGPGGSKRRIRKYTPTKADRVTFDDIAGIDLIKGEMQEIVDMVKDPKKYAELNAKPPRGILLLGPPGNGKTMLARAVACEADIPFFATSGADIDGMYVGDGAAVIRNLFSDARKNAPSIIFIDEIDVLGKARTQRENRWSAQSITQLLKELDGIEPAHGVTLIAATNRPDTLDPALLRPGRLDRRIEVPMPDSKSILEILTLHAKKTKLASDVDLAEVAGDLAGFSAAAIANLVNVACLTAVRNRHKAVTRGDFTDAFDRIVLGLERRGLVLTKLQQQLTNNHEAGHTILKLVVEGASDVSRVSNIPRGNALGITMSRYDGDRVAHSKEQLFAEIVVLFGGLLAERMLLQDDKYESTGASSDIAMATEIANRIVTEYGMDDAVGKIRLAPMPNGQTIFSEGMSEHMKAKVERRITEIIKVAMDVAKAALEENNGALTTLAAEIERKRTLSAPEIKQLIPERSIRRVQHPLEKLDNIAA